MTLPLGPGPFFLKKEIEKIIFLSIWAIETPKAIEEEEGIGDERGRWSGTPPERRERVPEEAPPL